MKIFPREEIEQAFHHYFKVGIVDEDWVGWSQCFTEDATYHDHFYGTFRGPKEIEMFLEGTMSAAPQVYSVYHWHNIDGNRLVYQIANHADSPVAGEPPIGFSSVQVVTYAGDGKFSAEEDWWVLYDMVRARNRWLDALARGGDPDFGQRMSRANWGDVPEWARAAPEHVAKPSWLGKGITPINGIRDITFGTRTPKA
jgi:hypothetical protein